MLSRAACPAPPRLADDEYAHVNGHLSADGVQFALRIEELDKAAQQRSFRLQPESECAANREVGVEPRVQFDGRHFPPPIHGRATAASACRSSFA